jgi:hypothetical protein
MTKAPPLNVFFASATGDGDDEVAAAVAALQAEWPGALIHSARDVWKSLGLGWDAFSREVAQGCNLDGSPRFDAYVVPNLRVGRATSTIIEQALAFHKPIFCLPYGTTEPTVVAGIVCRDPNSWKAGWELILGPAVA